MFVPTAQAFARPNSAVTFNARYVSPVLCSNSQLIKVQKCKKEPWTRCEWHSDEDQAKLDAFDLAQTETAATASGTNQGNRVAPPTGTGEAAARAAPTYNEKEGKKKAEQVDEDEAAKDATATLTIRPWYSKGHRKGY